MEIYRILEDHCLHLKFLSGQRQRRYLFNHHNNLQWLPQHRHLRHLSQRNLQTPQMPTDMRVDGTPSKIRNQTCHMLLMMMGTVWRGGPPTLAK